MYGIRDVVDACFQLILIHSDTFSMYMLGLYRVELGNIPVLYRNDDILFTPV